MAQPPAWLRHHAVEASPRAIVSITWKKVEGIGLDPVRRARQQQAEQPRLVELVEQRGRQPARLLDLVRSGLDGRLGRPRHARSRQGRRRDSAADGINVSKTIPFERVVHQAVASSLSICSDRPALGFQPEEAIDHPGHQEPAAEIEKGRRNLAAAARRASGSCSTRRSARGSGADDLADAAEAVGRAHARGARCEGQTSAVLRSDDREASVGEEEGQRQDQPQGRQRPHRRCCSCSPLG